MATTQTLMLIRDIIEQARADEEERLENMIFLLDTAGLTLCKAIIAWPQVRVVVEPEGPPPEKDKMSWLWSGCRYDVKTMASILGVEQQRATELVKQLRDMGMIYPDGTVNTVARKLVGSRIRKEMSKFINVKPTQQSGSAGA